MFSGKSDGSDVCLLLVNHPLILLNSGFPNNNGIPNADLSILYSTPHMFLIHLAGVDKNLTNLVKIGDLFTPD